jgi:3-oxoacyl-[acyl-carrier-protein] synthase III
MADAGIQAMREANVRAQEINWWIPHQANLRLIRETGDILGISMENTVTVIDRYANSSGATIPIALAEAVAAGTIRRGELLLLTAVGAGLTNAGMILRW